MLIQMHDVYWLSLLMCANTSGKMMRRTKQVFGKPESSSETKRKNNL